MARPVQYNKQLVLQKALETFWFKGYQGTSIAELIKATGLTSRSMYNLFGSKNGLFKESLLRYYQIGIKGPIDRLKTGKGIQAVQNYVREMTTGTPLNGCLFVNTMSEKNLIQQDCLELVMGHFDNLEELLRGKLEWSKEHENFSGDPDLRAKQLVIILQGIAQYTKTGANPSEIKRIVDDLTAVLGV
ncbi:MAG: TetR/AcrR family transcriptional regulator [Proteobacteria bacterium]|nr:TetR/AcrR family transcriptional regulator [Pseudomonadota bacterium]